MTRPKSIALDFDKTIFGGEFTSTDVVEGPPIVGAIEWLREQLSATDEQLRRAMTRKIEDQAHAIDVLAELAAAGDVDGIRMHFEHLKGSKGRL